MAGYIDREALIQELDAKLGALHGELDEKRIVYDAFTDGFEECVGEVGKFQFSADVAPVVRCKDCKHYEPEEYECGCVFAGGLSYVKADDYCSYGERRGGGEDG